MKRKEKINNPPDEAEKKVKRKVRKEYREFLASYKKLPDERRYRARICDAYRFYRNMYIIIVIIGDFTIEEWKWLWLYYEHTDIIGDFYKSYLAFRRDFDEENKDRPDMSFLASSGFPDRNLGAWA